MATSVSSNTPYVPPSNHAEYMQRLAENSMITGRYLDTAMHMPCPFCAAPEFLVYRIMETQQRLAEGAVCKKCLRGAKVMFRPFSSINPNAYGASFEFVQTCGPDQPDWMKDKMRRVDG